MMTGGPLGAGLPVAEVLGSLTDAVASSGMAVLSAPPGAGKTTLVPIHLAEAVPGTVLLLEPRRAAARAAARRIATLLGEELGNHVGLRTGDETVAARIPRIEVVTNGVLPRLLHGDPSLAGVDVVVFDEFHERSLEADLAMALLLDAQAALRPDLKVVVMSATLDVAALTTLLDDPPVLVSLGRAFPVETIWFGAPPSMWERAVADAIEHAVRNQQAGDVLVFCPGLPEIGRVRRELAKASSRADWANVDVVDLHGSQTAVEQDRVLGETAHRRRRVVLATSIAETSLTLPGVTAVVDGGLVRRNAFDVRRGLGGLVTEPVSKATAEQRAGRAGRVQNGVCYRLWDETEHRRKREHPTPEILDADLTALALHLAVWGPAELRFIDHPPDARLGAARDLLRQLELIDDAGRATERGLAVFDLGLDPRLGVIVAAGREIGAPSTAIALAALLSERDLLDGPLAGRPSDIAERLSALAGHRPVDRFRRSRVLDVAKRIARRAGVTFSIDAALDGVDQSGLLLSTGFPDRIGRARGNETFTLTSGTGVALARGDALAGSSWIVAAEIDRGTATGGADGRVLIAAPIGESELLTLHRSRVATTTEVLWHDGDVVARERTTLGSVTVRDRPIEPPAEQVLAALIDGLTRERLAPLPFAPSVQSWRERVLCCRRYLGDEWPDVSDDGLVASLDTWFVPFSLGVRRRADLARVDVAAAIGTLVPYTLASQLDRLAPTYITVPSGSNVAIDYEPETPVLAVKLQELFGLLETPRLGDGRIPLVVHLLSPAGAPLQVTADLASFWRTGYAAVRADMRGRYPKHPWPEDPLTATATAKTNRALRRD